MKKRRIGLTRKNLFLLFPPFKLYTPPLQLGSPSPPLTHKHFQRVVANNNRLLYMGASEIDYGSILTHTHTHLSLSLSSESQTWTRKTVGAETIRPSCKSECWKGERRERERERERCLKVHACYAFCLSLSLPRKAWVVVFSILSLFKSL